MTDRPAARSVCSSRMMRRGAVAARRAHNPKVVGASPTARNGMILKTWCGSRVEVRGFKMLTRWALGWARRGWRLDGFRARERERARLVFCAERERISARVRLRKLHCPGLHHPQGWCGLCDWWDKLTLSPSAVVPHNTPGAVEVVATGFSCREAPSDQRAVATRQIKRKNP